MSTTNAAGAARRHRYRHRAAVWSIRLLVVAVLFGAWLYETGPGKVSPLLLPHLSDVAQSFYQTIKTGSVWSDAWVTVAEFLLAFCLAAGAGVVVGFLCSRTHLRSQIADPLLNFGYMVPLAMFFPIFTLWFGVGIASKVFYAGVGGFFPVAVNAIRGFRSVDGRLLRMGRAFGASRVQSELQIKWGAALPLVLTGIRLGAATSLIGVVLGEMLAAERGLGYELTRSSQSFQTADTYALVVLLLVIVVVIQMLIGRLDTQRGRKRRRGWVMTSATSRRAAAADSNLEEAVPSDQVAV
ncbi:MAG: NitT/TauT family transport system permease protein [Pseudonocardiales bacterium]|nr:NitT/TauT family transport system permease protein [Pseudonocardiales bacterium]